MVQLNSHFLEELISALSRALPDGERMTPPQKEFWLAVANELGPDRLQQLAKVVAFMRKVEGF